MDTARLLLRELRDTDAAVLARELASYQISRNTSSIPHPYTQADALEFIARQKAKKSASIKKVIALKHAPDELIGSVRLHISPEAGTCELGYWIAESHWGQGFASEAAACMVEHAFTALSLPALEADYNTDNPASGRVLQRLGFLEIGNGEDFSTAQGKLVPVILMKLTKERWKA